MKRLIVGNYMASQPSMQVQQAMRLFSRKVTTPMGKSKAKLGSKGGLPINFATLQSETAGAYDRKKPPISGF